MRNLITLFIAFGAVTANATVEGDYQRCLTKLSTYQEMIDIRMDYQTNRCHYFGMPCKYEDRKTTVDFPRGAYDDGTVYLQSKSRAVAEYCMKLLDQIESSTKEGE